MSENQKKIRFEGILGGLCSILLLKAGLMSRQCCSWVLKNFRDEDCATSLGCSYSHILFLMWKIFSFCPNRTPLIATCHCCESSRFELKLFFPLYIKILFVTLFCQAVPSFLPVAIHTYKLQQSGSSCVYSFKFKCHILILLAPSKVHHYMSFVDFSSECLLIRLI